LFFSATIFRYRDFFGVLLRSKVSESIQIISAESEFFHWRSQTAKS
jgi:hypothetical protein